MKIFWKDTDKTQCLIIIIVVLKNVPKWEKIKSRKTNQKKLAVIQLRDYSGLESYGGSEDKDKETNGLINIFASISKRDEVKDDTQISKKLGWKEVTCRNTEHWISKFRKRKKDVNIKHKWKD